MTGKNKLPNLICPGAQKAGTTTLYHILKQHPNVYVSEYKELYYFCWDNYYKKGIKWYLKHFKSYNQEKYIADITPDYLPFLKTADRINKTLNDEVKFIVMLRNPVQRAYSHYLMKHREGKIRKSFNDVIFAEYKTEKESSLLHGGMYYEQLKHYLKYYPLSNFHFILLDDLKNNFDKVVKELFSFLDLETILITQEKKYNTNFQPRRPLLFKLIKLIPNRLKIKIKKTTNFSSEKNITRLLVGEKDSEKQNIDKELYNKLVTFYQKDIIQLEKLIGRDLSKWLQE